MSPFHSRAVHRVSISSSASSARREPVSKVRKKSAILKRAMTERRTGWSGRDWNSKPRNHWRSSPVEGSSLHDKWKSSKPQGKWKDISAEMDALGLAFKETSNTWTKNCKESAKKEYELYKMVELAAIYER